MTTSIPTRHVAATLRARLAAEFPTVKFSVTKGAGSDDAWLSVSWTDGPDANDVCAVTRQYEGKSWDGRSDRYRGTGNLLTATIDGHEVTGTPDCEGVTPRHLLSAEVTEEAGRLWSTAHGADTWHGAGQYGACLVEGHHIPAGWAHQQVHVIACQVILPRRWAAVQPSREAAPAEIPGTYWGVPVPAWIGDRWTTAHAAEWRQGVDDALGPCR